MISPRNIKEILVIVLDNIETAFAGGSVDGICDMRHYLIKLALINKRELNTFSTYLHDNLPASPFDDGDESDGFCWPYSELEPRVKWLNEQIEKL